jgi:hypothetical protein
MTHLKSRNLEMLPCRYRPVLGIDRGRAKGVKALNNDGELLTKGNVMKRIKSLFGILTIAAALAVSGQAQILTFNNCNYGLLPGEPQFLTMNNPYSTQVEQFSYTVTGPFDHTTTTLRQGLAYDIRISGRVGVGPLDGSNNSTPDAAYAFVNWQNLDLVHVSYQSPVVTWDNVGDGINYRRPSPDIYATAHAYDYYIEGHDAGLAFSFRDDPYWDNIGGYQVTTCSYIRIQMHRGSPSMRQPLKRCGAERRSAANIRR